MNNEDPFLPMASINITVMDIRALQNEKKDERFSPNAMIRKVWVPKQYLVHKDELAVKEKCLQPKKRKRMEGIHTIQKRKNPPNERMLF